VNIENIAKAAHELNKAYCESIGDNSQPSWEDAPEWQKSSAINGVQFHLDNPDATPSASHESWLKQKTEEGWKYGEVKNPETKEHPCFVPYEQLPNEQKAKDYIFRQTIHSLKPYLEEDTIKVIDIETELKTELSFGEKLVGLNFNPSNDDKVSKAKMLCAELADLANDEFLNREESQVTYLSESLFVHTIGEILNAQMNVVKLLTLKY
jgi:hypothetical protein